MSKEPKPAPEPIDPLQSINEPAGSAVAPPVEPPTEPKPEPRPAPKHDEERRRR